MIRQATPSPSVVAAYFRSRPGEASDIGAALAGALLVAAVDPAEDADAIRKTLSIELQAPERTMIPAFLMPQILAA